MFEDCAAKLGELIARDQSAAQVVVGLFNGDVLVESGQVIAGERLTLEIGEDGGCDENDHQQHGDLDDRGEEGVQGFEVRLSDEGEGAAERRCERCPAAGRCYPDSSSASFADSMTSSTSPYSLAS